MRRLTQPNVMAAASVAAGLTALACYPRILFWNERVFPLWFYEAALFGCSAVLWAFVFAWQQQAKNASLFRPCTQPRPWAEVLATSLLIASVYHVYLDPTLRQLLPDEYPVTLRDWGAQTLFVLAFQPLFLIFAPYAFFVRLFKNRNLAANLTVIFGVVLWICKPTGGATSLPPILAGLFVISKVAGGFLSVRFYTQGGVWLVVCWGFIIQLRHLLK